MDAAFQAIGGISVMSGRFIQGFPVKVDLRLFPRGKQQMMHNANACLKAVMPHVKPPCAYGGLAHRHLLRSGVRRAEAGEDIVDLARASALVGSHVELRGPGPAVPSVKGHQTVGFHEDPQGVWVQRVRAHVERGVTGGTTHVRGLGPELGLKVPSHNKGGAHGNPANRVAEFVQEFLTLVPQNIGAAGKIMRVLVAIVDLGPPFFRGELDPEDPTRDNLLMPNTVRAESGVEKSENSIRPSRGPRVDGSPSLRLELRAGRPMRFLKKDNIVLVCRCEQILTKLLPK